MRIATSTICINPTFPIKQACYIECVDISKCSLIAYSNGHSPYVTGLNDNFITYEKFTDTLTLDCKKELMALYSKYGK
mgnify:CR=1 FL=1